MLSVDSSGKLAIRSHREAARGHREATHVHCAYPQHAHGTAQVQLLLMELATALHRFGVAAHRLESTLGFLAKSMEVDARFFCVPTAIFACFGPPGAAHTQVLRMGGQQTDLGKLDALYAIAPKVVQREISMGVARSQIRKICERKPPYSSWLAMVSYGVVAASVGVFLGADAKGVLAALCVGLHTGLLCEKAAGVLGSLLLPLCASSGALSASLLAYFGLGQLQTSVLAGLVVLLPGLSFTTALNELATQNLAAGTARLLSACSTFLQLGLGVAMGMALGRNLFPPAPHAAPISLSSGWQLPALVASALGLVVLFRAPKKDAPLIAAVCASGFFANKLAGDALGSSVGVMIASFCVGVIANGFARVSGRPALLLLLPAIILLVPGGAGFRSLGKLLAQDAVGGVNGVFAMGMSAVALVAGLLLANRLSPASPLPIRAVAGR